MSGKGNNIRDLVGLMHGMSKSHVKVQTAWATVTAVDWDDKSMTAVGVTDNLAYHDISLGLGAVSIKPQVGSVCLIGMVENQDAAAFLIDAEVVEEYALKVFDKVSISNETESLKELMSDTLDAIERMAFTTNTGTTIKLINKLEFTDLKTRFNNLLK